MVDDTIFSVRRKENSLVRTIKQVTKKKANGVHFTPHELACFVARRIIKSISLNSVSSIKVLDPACGDGELLLAFAETLPPVYLDKITLIGVESDNQALKRTKERLEKTYIEHFTLENGDFLELCKNQLVQPDLFNTVPSCDALLEPADIIIANPPYVRTQVLGSAKAQELAVSFGLTGRVDLYHAFLIGMTHQLAPDGILGVITSNRFLSTQGGSSIRAFMAREYDIIEVFDLGDTKLFEAAVLPAVFIGRKRSQAKGNHLFAHREARFVRIYENVKAGTSADTGAKKSSSIYNALEDGDNGDHNVSGQCFRVSAGILSLPSSPEEPWSMATSSEQAWLNIVNSHTKLRISNIAKVRVGIKTTADEVFIRTDWNDLPADIRPEEQLLCQLLSHENADRWVPKIGKSLSRQVLYTHTVKNGKRIAIDLNEYPRAAAYFERHHDRLASRTYVLSAKRHWYEIWVPQNPLAWKQPKLVFPDISSQPKFFYDAQARIVDGDCYWIDLNTNQSPDILFLIAGLANSNLMTYYHDLVFNNKLYSGRRRYLTQYVENYPLPDPLLLSCQEIVSLVKELVFSPLSDKLQKQKERDLEILVAQAFGVDPIFDT